MNNEDQNATFEARHSFNQATAMATDQDFQYWSRAEIWTLHEAAVLINSRKPSAISEYAIEREQPRFKIVVALKQTLDLLERARYAGSLNRANHPKTYVEWLELKGMEMPRMLKELVQSRSSTPFTVLGENQRLKKQIEELQNQLAMGKPITNTKDKTISAREQDSLLKLVLGMAIAAYGYDPKATRSKEVAQIASDLRLKGLPLDEDTVRKHLNTAKEQFSIEHD